MTAAHLSALARLAAAEPLGARPRQLNTSCATLETLIDLGYAENLTSPRADKPIVSGKHTVRATRAGLDRLAELADAFGRSNWQIPGAQGVPLAPPPKPTIH
ncbi:MAG TPA: hypothetical protein VGP64_18040 [Polyangia bacterium]